MNCIAPGFVDTPQARGSTQSKRKAIEKAARYHPMGRIGQPEEIAEHDSLFGL